MPSIETPHPLGALPDSDLQVVAHVLETIDTLVRTIDTLGDAVACLIQLDDIRQARIAKLAAMVQALADHAGLDVTDVTVGTREPGSGAVPAPESINAWVAGQREYWAEVQRLQAERKAASPDA